MSEFPCPIPVVVRYAVTADGDMHLDNAGLALLFGVSAADLVAGETHSADRWRSAARRIKEAEAHGSGSGLGAVLAYWCEVERDGAELVLIEQP